MARWSSRSSGPPGRTPLRCPRAQQETRRGRSATASSSQRSTSAKDPQQALAHQLPDGRVRIVAESSEVARAAPVLPRARRRPRGVPAPLPLRSVDRARHEPPGRPAPAARRNGRPCAAPRALRTADPGERGAPDRAPRDHRRRRVELGRFHVSPTTAQLAAFSPQSSASSGSTRAAAQRSSASAALSTSRHCATADGGDGRALSPRARPRPVVARRHLARGARPLGPWARRRPRAREAPGSAPRAAGRGVGDGGAARAVRRVGGHRLRLPPVGIRARARPAPRRRARPRVEP